MRYIYCVLVDKPSHFAKTSRGCPLVYIFVILFMAHCRATASSRWVNGHPSDVAHDIILPLSF